MIHLPVITCIELKKYETAHVDYQVLVVAAITAVVGQASKYPAGLNPALCPNYPHCNNVLLALHSNTGYHVPFAAAAHNYPAGVSPLACPNYPYCSNYLPVAPLHGYRARQLPAGVNAAACPNYPYCF
jgi:hypothetical protein